MTALSSMRKDFGEAEQTMQAVICLEPGRLALVERPVPAAELGSVPVDIRAIGICGTDFHIFEGTHPFLEYPRIMGHELSGIVAEGSRSVGLPPGTPVIVNPYIACGVCIACRKGKPNCCTRLNVLGVHIDGGMCERIVVPEENLYPAGGLSLRDAAMVEFLSIGAHAVRRSELGRGDRAVVVGAGPIGVATALFARLAGAEVTVMDIAEKRLAYIESAFGLGQAILAGPHAGAEIERLTGGDFFDVVFDATGNARAMEGSFGLVAHGGKLVMVGVLKADIAFADGEFHKREMTVLATRNATRKDFRTVTGAIADGLIPLDALNTHSGTLASLPEAMPAWLKSTEPPLKAIVTVAP
jgi:2-desacetyl-2-hydroxyethyl bacteriochlorophyllide A dehydrogenase